MQMAGIETQGREGKEKMTPLFTASRDFLLPGNLSY